MRRDLPGEGRYYTVEKEAYWIIMNTFTEMDMKGPLEKNQRETDAQREA